MLKYLFLLLSLVGLSTCSGLAVAVVDGIPNQSAIGGHGEFIRDPIADSGIEHVIAAGSSLVPDGVPGLNSGVVRDVVGRPRINGGVVHDVVPGSRAVIHDVVPGSRAVVHDVVPGSRAVIHDVVPGSRAVVHDVVPGSRAVVHDVVPGSRAVVHDVVPGSRAVVHDVVPASRAIVHDVVPGSRAVFHGVVPGSRAVVHDVVPGSRAVVHDVVPGPRAVVHDIPRSAGVVHDVVPVSRGNFVRAPAQRVGHAVLPAVHNVLPSLPPFPSGNSFFRRDNGIGTSLVAPSARYVDPASLKCGLKPEPFIAYQLSRFSYNYPRYEIQKEWEQRPEIRPAVLALATRGRFSGRYGYKPRNNVYTHRNKREAGRIHGCVGEALTLRSFYAYNNYCWLVAPVYQDVPFYNCYQGCNYKQGYGSVSRCEASYIHRKVLAYCAGLPYGKRIGYVNLPVPTACSCKTYTCSS